MESPAEGVESKMRQTPQLKNKVALRDYYDNGPITPKKLHTEKSEFNNTTVENFDTQVMNIEADFE